jgi:hypothetical protein
MTKVTVELPPDEARALAQFVKRTGFDDCKRLASRCVCEETRAHA